MGSLAPEVVVTARSAMPKGYGFLKKGDPYKTGLCRRKTHAAGKTLFVVKDDKTILGLRAPRWIIDEVDTSERATRDQRRQNVEKHDAAEKDKFKASIQQYFPRIPPEEIPPLIDRALKKRSGRVGRTGRLDLDEKTRFAVIAHIRHVHTKYDSIINATGKKQARKDVEQEVLKIASKWTGGQGLSSVLSKRREAAGNANKKKKKRKVKKPRDKDRASQKSISQPSVPKEESSSALRQRKRKRSVHDAGPVTRKRTQVLGNEAQFEMLDQFSNDDEVIVISSDDEGDSNGEQGDDVGLSAVDDYSDDFIEDDDDEDGEDDYVAILVD